MKGQPPAAHRVGRDAIGLSLLVAATGFVAARTQPLWGKHLQLLCPLLEFTGVPCPTCGGTRALVALASADPAAAMAWNPLVTVIGVAAAVWCVAAPFMLVGLAPTPALPTALPTWVRWTIPAAVLANEAWLLACFPG